MSKTAVITLSFLLSLILSVLPLPEGLLELNPAWCLLTLLFWTYSNPRRVNIGVAWCIGMMVDGLTGSLIGLHALTFVIVVYVFDLFYRRFQMFHVLQQSLVIGVLVTGSFFISFSVRHMLSDSTFAWPMLLCAITSGVCWPFYQFLGQKFHLMRS